MHQTALLPPVLPGLRRTLKALLYGTFPGLSGRPGACNPEYQSPRDDLAALSPAITDGR